MGSTHTGVVLCAFEPAACDNSEQCTCGGKAISKPVPTIFTFGTIVNYKLLRYTLSVEMSASPISMT